MDKKYIENIDQWIKEINAKLVLLEELPKIIQENIENIQNDYELIMEQRERIEELEKEVNTLRFVQYVRTYPIRKVKQ